MVIANEAIQVSAQKGKSKAKQESGNIPAPVRNDKVLESLHISLALATTDLIRSDCADVVRTDTAWY